uniref:DUF4283 domain-containing protein n=1 Tax=Cannabis sativa TaxID=3483 RepID=A0A803QHA8_CANSA
MAKTRSKHQGKLKLIEKVIVKKKKRGHSSSEVKKTKSMEEVLRVEPFELTDEEGDRQIAHQGATLNDFFPNPLTPRSSLNAILQQEEVQRDFNFFLAANHECSKDVANGSHATPPVLRSGSAVRNLSNSFENSKKLAQVKVILDDIAEEISFWNSSLVCYILGENPPLNVLDGFVRRLWKDKIDKVDIFFFNKRLVIMKAWDPNVNSKKEDVSRVPIWVTLDDLELKYWGEKSLFKIIGQIGDPIMVDAVTKERDKLSYPRVLIEVSIHQEFPHTIYFENEHGVNVPVAISFEWKPILCKNCKGMGHETIDCRKKDKVQQQWVIKNDARKPTESTVIDQGKKDDFQPVTKGWKVKGKEPPKQIVTANSFNVLEQEGEGKEDMVADGSIADGLQECNTREGGEPSLANG